MLTVGPLVPGVERIAVLRANAIGDLVVALPALEALRAAYPTADITLLGRRHHVDLLGRAPSPVDRVIPLPAGAIGDETDGGRRLDPDARAPQDELAAQHFDLAIQLHGGGRNSNGFVNGLRARVTAGSRTPDAPSLDRWVPYHHYQWEVARYLEVVGLVGARPVVIEPRLPVSPADTRSARAELQLGDAPYVVVHPGASDPRRRWPPERFAGVGAALRATGRRVVVTGTAAEADLVSAVIDGLGGDAVRADRLGLTTLLGLLAGSDLVLANDTGPLHLAIATGTPTVGIFWVGNLINAGPFTRRLHRPLLSWRLACPVCGVYANRERCAHDPSYVDEIPEGAAIDAGLSLLSQGAMRA